jgi:hypothetical protein
MKVIGLEIDGVYHDIEGKTVNVIQGMPKRDWNGGIIKDGRLSISNSGPYSYISGYSAHKHIVNEREKKNMNFKEAFQLMKEGKKVKLPNWGGYWAWENETIMMHCKDGQIIDIKDMRSASGTMSNICSGEWEVVEDTTLKLDPKKQIENLLFTVRHLANKLPDCRSTSSFKTKIQEAGHWLAEIF